MQLFTPFPARCKLIGTSANHPISFDDLFLVPDAKGTADGGPVRSFATLLRDLATLVKNAVEVPAEVLPAEVPET